LSGFVAISTLPDGRRLFNPPWRRAKLHLPVFFVACARAVMATSTPPPDIVGTVKDVGDIVVNVLTILALSGRWAALVG
jgi:hypothetical protein